MRVSVVIPTYRRPALLARCLDALAAQGLPPSNYEILVADDAASPETRAQVEAFAAQTAAPVRYVPVTGPHGPAAARNAGWRVARGAVAAFTDDDTIPDPDWLSVGVAAFERDPDLVAAAGQVFVPLPPVPTDYERNESGLGTAEFVTANCFVRRSALGLVGGFDERFRAAWREDSDLQFSLLERGLKVGKVPGAVVAHPVRPASWGICLRQQRKVFYDALLYKKHPELFRRRVRPLRVWDYHAIVAVLLGACAAVWAGTPAVALGAAGVWAGLTGRFLARRLRDTSHAPRHVAEMVVTSALIPPLALFWRLAGACRFRVWFY